MNIFKLFNEVIQWCDGNVGFLNVILSICTLTLTITIAKIPYKRKIVGSLDVTLEKIENETSYKSIIKVYLTNVGRVPVYIKSVDIIDWKGKNLGSCDMNLRYSQCKELGASKSYSCQGIFSDPVFVKHAINLNGYVKIRVTDISGKKYYISRTFPVG